MRPPSKQIEISGLDLEDYVDDNMGICLACHELSDCVEPDAEGYTCQSCAKREVVGMEVAIYNRHIRIVAPYAPE